MSAKGGEKLEIKVTKLKEVMDLMKPVVPRKPTVKSVACLCLGNGKAVATDLETMVIANLPEAKEPMLLPYSADCRNVKVRTRQRDTQNRAKEQNGLPCLERWQRKLSYRGLHGLPRHAGNGCQSRWVSRRRYPDSGNAGRSTIHRRRYHPARAERRDTGVRDSHRGRGR